MKKINKTPEQRSKFTNGDDEDVGSSEVSDRCVEDPRSLLEEQLRALSINVRGTYNFFKFDGKRAAAKDFLLQFKPFKVGWDEETYFNFVESNLQGKAMLWFEGSRNSLFKTVEEFENEFLDYFGIEEESGNTKFMSILTSSKLGLTNNEFFWLKIYSIHTKITVSLKDIIGIAVKDCETPIARRYKECRTWNAVLKLAVDIDIENCDIRTKESTQKAKSSRGSDAEIRHVGKKVRCFNCKGGHYMNKCPFISRNTGKQSDKSVTELKDRKILEGKPPPSGNSIRKLMTLTCKSENSDLPRFLVQIGDLKVPALLDYGADINFINYDLLRRLNLDIDTDNRVKVNLAKGSDHSLGSLRARIRDRRGENSYETQFAVIDNLNEEIIIGSKMSKTLNIKVHWEDNEVEIFNGTRLKLETKEYKLMLICTEDLRDDLVIDCKFGNNERVNKRIKYFLKEYYELLDRTSARLPIKHAIKLSDKNASITCKPYRRSPQQNLLIKERIKELLSKGLIRDSTSKYVSPVVLAPKKDGTMRMCVDYRKLNSYTVYEPYPIPNIEEAFDSLGGTDLYTSLDLEMGYHQVDIDPKDIYKTAFIVKDGVYEWIKMPFGLINAPFTFQKIMNWVFKEILWEKVIVYLDDILVFSKGEDNHIRDVKQVLGILAKYGLRINPKKCSFGVESIDFLGHSVENGSLKIKKDQIEKVKGLKPPRNVSELRKLLGFIVYFKKFIPGYTTKVSPLLARLKKGNFKFEDKERDTLEILKREIENAKPLALPDMSKKFYMYTDASDVGIAGVLTQIDAKGEEKPITWISRALNSAEMNYTTTEKEALAIVWSIEKLKVYLANKFIIRTDHSALIWLMKQKNPAGRLARWVMKLQNYQFDIEHIRGTENTIADVLSRGVLIQMNFDAQECKNIKSCEKVLDIEKDENAVKELIMKSHLELGHSGVDSTAMYIKNIASIPNIRKKIIEYINNCETCRRFKDKRLQNNIKRIEIKSPFHMIGLDIVGPLPRTENGNRFIIVGTDYLTKWAETRALKKKSAELVSKFIYEEFVLRHGPPEILLTDQGLEFNNVIVKKLCELINTRKAFTSAYNPRCNGQTERLNRTLIAKLAKLCNGRWSEWDRFLPVALYAYRIAPLTRFKCSPFKLLYGRDPYDMVVVEPSSREISENEDDLLKQIDMLRKGLHEMIQDSRKREIETNDPKIKENKIMAGDIVMKKKEPFERLNKLDDKWTGPYLVKRKFDSGGFEIEDMFGRLLRYNEKDLQLMEGSDLEDWENLKKGSVLQDSKAITDIIL